MDFNETFTGKLISGIEIVLMRMKGYHQEAMFKMLTSKAKKKKTPGVLNEIEDIVAERIVTLGGVDFTKLNHEEKMAQFKKLEAADYAMALLLLRFFTVDLHFQERWDLNEQIKAAQKELEGIGTEIEQLEDREEIEKQIAELTEQLNALPPHIFKFKYEYESEKDEVMAEEKYELPMDLGTFPVRYGSVFGTTLDEVDSKKKIRVTLPMTKKIIEFSILSLADEIRFGEKNSDEKNRTLKTTVEMRNAMEVTKSSGGDREMVNPYNYTKGEYLDNDFLVAEIIRHEHKIDTNIALRHPETKELFKVDLMRTPTFFFPSGALQ